MVTFTLNLLILGYLKDSNAAAHSVDTDISQAVRLKRIENDIEYPIYMLENNNYYQSIERTRGNVGQKMIKSLSTLVFPQLIEVNDRNSDCLSIYLIYAVEPITWSLHLPYKPLESTLSGEKLVQVLA